MSEDLKITAALKRIKGQYFNQDLEDLSNGYKLGSKLGRGNFGVVRLAKHIDSKTEVAVKELSKEIMKKYKDEERVHREIEILAKVEHPNISYLYEILDEDDKFYFVMEYCKGGDLGDFIEKFGIVGDGSLKIAGEEEQSFVESETEGQRVQKFDQPHLEEKVAC
jgi:serine/threonine protein kinase